MNDKPRPYDATDPPRFGEWVWVGGLGATPAIDRGRSKTRLWVAILVVVALVAWSVAAFRGCQGEERPNAKLIFGESSLGTDGHLRGRIVVTVPEGRYIDAGLNGEDLGANLSLNGKIGTTVMEVVPAKIKYVQAHETKEVDGRVLLGGEVAIAVTIRDADESLPGEVAVSFRTTLVNSSGVSREEFSGSDTMRFGD